MLRLPWESSGANATLSQLVYVFETFHHRELIIKKGLGPAMGVGGRAVAFML